VSVFPGSNTYRTLSSTNALSYRNIKIYEATVPETQVRITLFGTW